MINLLGKMVGGDQNLELMASQLVGVAAASAVNGDVSLGAEIAKSGTAYNRQLQMKSNSHRMWSASNVMPRKMG